MKVYLPSMLAFSLLVAGCQIGPREAEATRTAEVDFEVEEAAILAVLEGESAAFWNKDFEGWASYWLHAPHVRTMGWWKAGGISVVEGWEEQSDKMRTLMAASPEPNSTATDAIRKNLNLRIFDEVAWLTFDQYGEDTGDASMDMAGRSRETRILEKHDGQWKIVYVGWLLEESDAQAAQP